jgi:hypothetical protein
MAGLIRPLIWNASKATLEQIREHTRFTLPAALYESLATALKTRNADGHFSVPQRSLELLVGWFAPNVAFIKRDGSVLRFYYLGGLDRSNAQSDLRDAFLLWLTVMGIRDTDASLQDRLTQAVEDVSNWEQLDADIQLTQAHNRCVRPNDPDLFDLLTQGVAQHLKGRAVTFGNHQWGQLILSGNKGNPFSGRELIIFPPTDAISTPDKGCWSEVIRISAMTSPETECMRIGVSLQVRNYAALTSAARFATNRRRLDVFFRARGLAHEEMRHGEIPFRLRGSDDEHVRPQYAFPNSDDLFKVLRTFGGLSALDPDTVPFNPICAEQGMWIIPRLGRGHGDDDLPAGQGLGWPERDAFAALLDDAFGAIGLTRMEEVQRTAVVRGIKLISPWSNPVRPKTEDVKRQQKYQSEATEAQGRRRALVAKALNDRPLRIALFFLRDESQADLSAALTDLFGAPSERTATEWRYADGLTIQICARKSGLLSDSLPERPVLSSQEQSRLKKDRWQAIIDDRHERLIEDREEAILSYVRATVEPWRDLGPWIALVEMHGRLRFLRLDPYTRVYSLIAQLGGLPQAILLDAQGKVNEYKIPGGLRDGIRMLGTAALDDLRLSSRTSIPDRIRWVGLWTVRRNQDDRAYERRPRHIFPLAVMNDGGGGLKVALLDADGGGGWTWIDYADASVRIGQLAVPTYAKARHDQRCQAFSQFYREVLESLLQDGIETVVMAQGGNIRNEIAAFSNSELCLGNFQIQGLPGTVPLRVEDGASNLSVIRLNTEPGKPVSYSRVHAKNFTQGTFQEPGRKRTYLGVRRPALSMELNPDWKPAMLSPRRPMSVEGIRADEVDPHLIGADRLAPVLEELVVVAHSATLSCDVLASLVRKLRSTHVSWSSETVLPYPLHEASRLENHLK